MKKIIQINVTCGRGSTGKLAAALYDGCLEAGCASGFAYGDFTPTVPTAFPIETKLQKTCRKICNRIFGRKQCHSNPGTGRLIRYLKQEKPDLVHLHNIHHNILHYGKLLAYLKENNIPAVFTLHDCWAFTGGCYHFTKHHCTGYQTDCSQCPLHHQRDDVSYTMAQGYQTRKWLIGENDHIYPVCVSHWLRDRARESYMGAMTHIPETIYNGIDTELFAPCNSDIRKVYGIPEKAFMVLGVASFWTEDKGLSLLLEVADQLPENSILVLVGQGNENLKHEKLISIPRTENQEQLAQLYSTADVYINSSIEETFGMTTAEALACGTPAIVFNSTACPEVVDEKTGIVTERDLQQLLAAISKIKEQGKNDYSAACVARAKTCFDEKRMVKEYLDLYRRILDEH